MQKSGTKIANNISNLIVFHFCRISCLRHYLESKSSLYIILLVLTDCNAWCIWILIEPFISRKSKVFFSVHQYVPVQTRTLRENQPQKEKKSIQRGFETKESCKLGSIISERMASRYFCYQLVVHIWSSKELIHFAKW